MGLARPQKRGYYFAVVGEVKQFKNQKDLKEFISKRDPHDGDLDIIKGKKVKATIENKPVISLDI